MTETRALHPVSDPTDGRTTSEAVLFEIRRVIVGQDAMLERVLVALLAGGHLLLEGVPGLAKSLTVKTLADVLDASFHRIQFTPDLVPADLVGTRIYRPDKSTFDTELGPVFCNFLLADEIDRAPAKVQSALLEVMQERQVTIGPETFPVPKPFLVATQNPIEAEAYPLPEARVDRFMMKVKVDYPTATEESMVVQWSLAAAADVTLDPHGRRSGYPASADRRGLRRRAIVDYAVALTRPPASRERRHVGCRTVHLVRGQSTRIDLSDPCRSCVGGRARTSLRPAQRRQRLLSRDVLRHRIVPSFAALADEVTADMILDRVLPAVAVPQLVGTEQTA